MRLLSNIIKSTRVSILSDDKYNLEVPNIFINKFVESDITKEVEEEKLEELTEEDIINMAKQKSEAILSDAKQEAQDIIDKAVNDAEFEAQKILENAQKQGYDLGYNKAISEVDLLKVQIQSELNLAIKEKEETLKAIEPNIVRMVLQISKTIFGKVLDINPETILLLMKKGLSEANTTGKISIHVSKYEYDVAQQNISKLYDFVGDNSEIEVQKDLSLDKGDCIIETPFGNVDSSFEQQFSSVRNELLYILENG